MSSSGAVTDECVRPMSLSSDEAKRKRERGNGFRATGITNETARAASKPEAEYLSCAPAYCAGDSSLLHLLEPPPTHT